MFRFLSRRRRKICREFHWRADEEEGEEEDEEEDEEKEEAKPEEGQEEVKM